MYKNFIFSVLAIFFYNLSYPMIHLYEKKNSTFKHISALDCKPSLTLTCNNTQLLRDRKDFLDQLADFTYPTPLYVIPSNHTRLRIKKSIQTLQYRDDFDLFGDPDNVTEIEMADDYIAKNKIDKTFILKRYVNQYGRNLPEKAISEAVGSYIGSSLGISVNKIKIIPARMPFAGKEFYDPPSFTATLHTYMPGKEIRLLESLKNIDLRCSFSTEDCFESAKWHQDLCDISILDICADNGDRHRYNYRFDEKNNRFHAYDMDESFNTTQTMAQEALKFFKEFLDNKNSNAEEKKTLMRLKNSLKRFLFNFPKGSLYDLWMQKAAEAEYIYNDNDKKNIEKKLNTHRIDIQKLHSFLENFISTTLNQKIEYKAEDLF